VVAVGLEVDEFDADLRELIESFYKAFNSHNVERIGEHLTEDFTQTTPYGASITKQQLLKHLEEVYKSVEDKHVEPLRWFIDGDEAAVVIESTGKHVGLFFEVQGKGKQFKITAVHLFKTRDDLIGTPRKGKVSLRDIFIEWAENATTTDFVLEYSGINATPSDYEVSRQYISLKDSSDNTFSGRLQIYKNYMGPLVKNNKVGILSFGSSVTLDQELSSNKPLILWHLGPVSTVDTGFGFGGLTAMPSAIEKSTEHLLSVDPTNKKIIVLVTDGAPTSFTLDYPTICGAYSIVCDTDERRVLATTYIKAEEAKLSGVKIIVIGVGVEATSVPDPLDNWASNISVSEYLSNYIASDGAYFNLSDFGGLEDTLRSIASCEALDRL